MNINDIINSISLIDKIEIYTKSDLVYYHPELTNLIKRERELNLEVVQAKLQELISKIKEHYKV